MKYRVSGQITISCFTDVEADSEDDAKQIASERQNQSVLSADRLGESPDDVWCHSGELDGEAQITEVEAIEP